MKILKVIHGYPPHYNAGSEVYSQTLCHGLSKNHEVHVFTRQENPFLPDYVLQEGIDPADPRIKLYVVNTVRERRRDQYSHTAIDNLFSQLLDKINPHVIHIGHLNHLSTSLVDKAYQKGIPMVFTLHDYWLMCPRGQFVQRHSPEPFALCHSQEDEKCARYCYAGCDSHKKESNEPDIDYWVHWISRRMGHIRSIVDKIDYFIAPSRYLLKRFQKDFGLPSHKLFYMDYGFDLNRFKPYQRHKEDLFTFGYIGTHIPTKGIQDLLKAFGSLETPSQLRIWGRDRSETNSFLRGIASHVKVLDKIEWMGEYNNHDIANDVFSKVDAIIVPSIWVENSPLVIHEAQQVGIPVITADVGGMAEYVRHGVNGLLFKHRNPQSLKEQMEKMAQNPSYAQQLGQKRYLYSKTGDVHSIEQNIEMLEEIYQKLQKKVIPSKPGPWRITFDTNPDQCNYKCIMCECFSPYSDKKQKRIDAKIPKRVMDIKLIRKILEEAQGTPLREIIPSTMGEPLLYNDFEEIVNLCHEFGLKLNLTTNGSFPIKGPQKWGEIILPVASDVKISWNGATKETLETIMLGSRWEKMLENLATFIKVRDHYAQSGLERASITLQLTFLTSNMKELSDMIRLGIKLGVDRIKGHHLWAHFQEIKDLSMRQNQQTIITWNEAVAEAIQVAHTTPLPNGQYIKLENIFPLPLTADTDIAPNGICPFLGQEAWVNTEGVFSPCCAPDDERKKLGYFGNLYNQSLAEIWRSPDYQSLRKHYLDHPLCVGCNMKKPLEAW